MFDNVILDWSGTLVDDLDAVIEGTNEAFRQHGFPEMSRSEFRREFDLPVRAFYDRRMPSVPFESLDVHFFTGFHRLESSIRPLDAAESFLEHAFACGVRLMVLTTLDRGNAERQLEQFGWNRFFDGIHAGVEDKVPHLIRLVEEEGLVRDRTVFVGDLPHDIEAGKAAGVKTCGVLSGYSDRTRLEPAEPDLLLDSVASLGQKIRPNGRRVEDRRANGTIRRDSNG